MSSSSSLSEPLLNGGGGDVEQQGEFQVVGQAKSKAKPSKKQREQLKKARANQHLQHEASSDESSDGPEQPSSKNQMIQMPRWTAKYMFRGQRDQDVEVCKQPEGLKGLTFEQVKPIIENVELRLSQLQRDHEKLAANSKQDHEKLTTNAKSGKQWMNAYLWIICIVGITLFGLTWYNTYEMNLSSMDFEDKSSDRMTKLKTNTEDTVSGFRNTLTDRLNQMTAKVQKVTDDISEVKKAAAGRQSEDLEAKVQALLQTSLQTIHASLNDLKEQVTTNTNLANTHASHLQRLDTDLQSNSDALSSYSKGLKGILFIKSATDECPPGSAETVCWHWFDASRWDPYCGDNNNAAAGLCELDQNNRRYNQMSCCYRA